MEWLIGQSRALCKSSANQHENPPPRCSMPTSAVLRVNSDRQCELRFESCIHTLRDIQKEKQKI